MLEGDMPATEARRLWAVVLFSSRLAPTIGKHNVSPTLSQPYCRDEDARATSYPDTVSGAIHQSLDHLLQPENDADQPIPIAVFSKI